MMKEWSIINTAYLTIPSAGLQAQFAYEDNGVKISNLSLGNATDLAEALSGIINAKHIDQVICNNQRGVLIGDLVNNNLNLYFNYNPIKFTLKEKE